MAFEQVVADSSRIVHGQVLDARTSMQEGVIWTHYRVRVLENVKGGAGSEVTVSEPGGTLNGLSLRVEGAVEFRPGDEAVLFLSQTPIGLWRITGWSQGRFDVSGEKTAKRVRAGHSAVSLLPNARAAAGTSVDRFDGITLTEFLATIRALAGKR